MSFESRFKVAAALLGLSLLSAVAPAATYQVGSIADLNTRIASAVAGDTIIVSNGVYTSGSAINITKVGTAASPITIKAQSIGGVEITGTKGFTLSSPAAYLTIQGFKFTHAGNISISSGTSFCRFTRNTVELAIPAGTDVSYFNISGNDAQIDHNELRNKSTLGEMLDITGSGSQVARRLWVHHNYFHDFTSPGGNGAEAIRWGLSGLSLSTGDGLCEYNLFVRCEGENEMISNKSSGNTYRFNTVLDCVGGEISQRHGNDCFYYGNYLRNTQGMRIYGDRHKIFNNYFESNSIGVNMGNGDGDVYNGALLTAHDRPDDNVVAFNTFIGNGTHYEMGGRTGGLGSSNTVVADNIFQGGGSMASISSSAPYTGTWTNNIRWSTSSAGNMPATGYTNVNPVIVKDSSGAYHLQSGSPAIDAGKGAYNYYGVYSTFSYVTNDMDGQPRDATKDIGADEFSAAPVLAHILSTNDVGPLSGLNNQLATAPASQTVPPGSAAIFTLTFTGANSTSTNLFTVGNLPANAAASFNPVALTNAGNSTLIVTTSSNTPLGTFVLTILGTGGGQTNTNTVNLMVSTNTLAQPGALLWTALGGADKTWNQAQNWTNTTSGGNGSPGPANDVVFANPGSVGTMLLTNNLVDVTFAGGGGTIRSLQYASTNAAYHTTFIAPGQILTISNNSTGQALLVGSATDNGSNATASVTAAITGGDGELDIIAPNGFFSVSQGGGVNGGTPTGAQRATLDLSGLGTLNVTAGNLFVGARDGAGLVTRACGVLYLARHNNLTLTSTGASALLVGDNGSGNGSGLASGIYLGQQNAISADAIVIGRQKSPGGAFLNFNPVFTNANPEAFIQGNSNPRVALYAVGDASLLNTTQSSMGTNDFTGGSVNLLADILVLGRGALSSGTGTGSGILTFTDGTIDVNTLEAGYQNGSVSPAIGVINLNGDSATLAVNSILRLARANGGTAQGTLNIRGGTVMAGTIVAGGGVSTITMNAGTLAVINTAGAPNAPLTALNITNATLHLNLNGAAIHTNLVMTTLNAAGLNGVVIDSAIGVTNTTVFPLIAYGAFNGSVVNNFVVVGLPDGISGGLVHNPAGKTIDLVLTPVANAVPRISTVFLSGANLVLQGTNGPPYGAYSLLASADLTLPLDQWEMADTGAFDPAGGFNLTTSVDPNQTGKFFVLKLQ